jgi:hypothetical protein
MAERDTAGTVVGDQVSWPGAMTEGRKLMRSGWDARRGLYRKFTVTRTDGDRDGKHRRCKYFVLDLTHDQFAAAALRAYATACSKEFPELALDLNALVHGDRSPLRKLRPSARRASPTSQALSDLAAVFRLKG